MEIRQWPVDGSFCIWWRVGSITYHHATYSEREAAHLLDTLAGYEMMFNSEAIGDSECGLEQFTKGKWKEWEDEGSGLAIGELIWELTKPEPREGASCSI